MTKIPRRIVFGIFLFSGSCALVYQIVWLRLAYASFGINAQVMSIVISVFMLGLGLGAWLAPKLLSFSRKLKIKELQLYAIAEAVIGLGAFAVPGLFSLGRSLLLILNQTNSISYFILTGVVILFSILPWSFAMGTTIPLMMQVVKKRIAQDDRSFSYLYLANTLGGMLGVVASLVLIELAGFKNTLLAASIMNFIIAGVCGFILPRYLTNGASDETMHSHPPVFPVDDLEIKKRTMTLWILFSTGFVSLGLEVAWTRLFTPVLQTTVYAFASILFFYLLGTALGSWQYRYDRSTNHKVSTGRLLWLLLIVCVAQFIVNDPRLSFGFSGIAVTITSFTFILGYLTPLQIDQMSGGDPKIAGIGYAVNIIGCILGPLVVGYWLLPSFGCNPSIFFLSLLLLAIIACHMKQGDSRLLWQKVGAAAMGAVIIVCSTASYEDGGNLLNKVLKRDYSATSIAYTQPGGGKGLLVNGVGITSMTTITKVMAHLPLALYSGQPHRALVICFGMGTTFRSALSWGVDTTAVELNPSVVGLFPYFFSDAQSALDNPKGHIVIDDGRRYLERSNQQFDIIAIDPPPPIPSAGSSLLYSEEFYQLAKSHLSAHGILEQWYPDDTGTILASVANAINDTFPYVRAFRSAFSDHTSGYWFLASNAPIPSLDPKSLEQKMPISAQADLTEWSQNKGAVSLLESVVSREVPITSLIDSSIPPITDDRPYNEYFLLRTLSGQT